jgi:hypothetical protein
VIDLTGSSPAGSAAAYEFLLRRIAAVGFTMSIRLSVVAFAMLAVAGCAPTYSGQPGVQPGTVTHQGGYGSNGGYAYGGGYGYDGGYDNDPIFRPSRSVTCDRTRDICYDRFGFDYYATTRYSASAPPTAASRSMASRCSCSRPSAASPATAARAPAPMPAASMTN